MSRDAKYIKEIEAQKKRVEALKHLEKQGQSVISSNKLQESVSKVVNVNKMGTDNTLDLLLRQGILSHQSSKEIEKNIKKALLDQQQALKPSGPDSKIDFNYVSESGWKAVEDKGSGKVYYWNTNTNETSWEEPSDLKDIKPQTTLTPTENLPAPWIKKVHPATMQEYYFNPETKQSSSEHPLMKKVVVEAAPPSDSLKRQVVEHADESNAKKARKSLATNIDPLDPMGGQVSPFLSRPPC